MAIQNKPHAATHGMRLMESLLALLAAEAALPPAFALGL
jgi:hypothetical protein